MNNKKRKFAKFETVEEYRQWSEGAYRKPHFILVVIPSQNIYACYRQSTDTGKSKDG